MVAITSYFIAGESKTGELGDLAKITLTTKGSAQPWARGVYCQVGLPLHLTLLPPGRSIT